MTQQVKRAKKFVRGRRFLTVAALTMVVVGLGVFAGTSFLAHAAGVNGDATCGYSGGFTESTVMQWAQVNGADPATATFSAFGTDENSLLLGVNSATPFPGTEPSHAHPGNGGDDSQLDASGRTYFPSLYITPVSGPGSWTKPGDAIPTASGDFQQGGKIWNDPSNQPYVDDVFGVWVTGTQTVAPRNAPGTIATTNMALVLGTQYGPTTTGGTYSLPTSALSAAVFTGDAIKLISGANNQTLTAAAPAAKNATSITVKSFKAGKSFPSGSTVQDTTAATGDYARTTTLPAQESSWTSPGLGTGSDVPTAGFSNLFFEKYATEFRWNISGLHNPSNNAVLQPGGWYKVQIIDHDGDQNKAGGDSGEFCTLIKIPGAPDIKTDPTGGTDITGKNVDGHIQQWMGTKIKDTAFLPAKPGFGNVTGSVTFNLYFDSGHAPNPAGSCVNSTDAPPGTLVYTDSGEILDGNDPSVATSGTYDTAGQGYGTYYWQDVFTPGGTNASSYTTVTEACGAETDQMVDARVRLTPHTAVNVVGNTHTLHAIAETSTNGTTWTAQPLETIDTSLNSGTNAAYNGASATATPPGSCQTASGKTALTDGTTTYCNVTITDDVVEDVLINATSDITVTGVTGGVHNPVDDSITRSTDNSASCSSDNATGATCEAIKHYINPKTTLTVKDTLKGLGSGATGTIEYTAYTSLTDCQGTTTNAGTTYDLTPTSNGVTGDAAPTSKSVDVAPGVTVYFTATYSGNEGDLTTSCTAETASSS